MANSANITSGLPKAPSSSSTGDRLAKTLGWASLGLGLPQVLRPGDTTKAIGLNDKSRNGSR